MDILRVFLSSSDGERIHLQCRRPGFDPWVVKMPWRRKWQPTPGSLPGKSVDRGAWQATVPFDRESEMVVGDSPQ